MEIQNDKLFRELQIYFDMGQNIAIVEPVKLEKKEIIKQFKEKILSEQETVYIDFSQIDNICDLAKNILGQCESIVLTYKLVKINITKVDCTDDYYVLDKALNMLQEVSEQISKDIVFILKNYTNVLKIKDGKRMQEHMRSVLQHQENILCVFIGENKELLNEIFMNPSAPFFRFVKMIDID